MKVFVETDRKEHEIEFSGTAKCLLEQLKINAETVVITRNNELITEEDELQDSDYVKIISVVSGG